MEEKKNADDRIINDNILIPPAPPSTRPWASCSSFETHSTTPYVSMATCLSTLPLPLQRSMRPGGSSRTVGGAAISMAEQLEGQDHPLDFSCTIMLLGKTGVGKSATINSIFDDDHQVKKMCITDAFQMGTKRVQLVEGFVQGIKVRVIDTPGLSPSWLDTQTQSIDDDMLLLRTITHVLGPSIWSNAIVGLTHAASAPPDGAASSYDMFVTRRCHAIQQDIRQAAGDVRLVNPHVSLVENHPACRTNRAGQKVLPNGQAWKPHLLLLSFASKILAEENAYDRNYNSRPLVVESTAQPLSLFLSSLLESHQLPPPFKRLTEAEISRLSIRKRETSTSYYSSTYHVSTYTNMIHMSYSGKVTENNLMKMKGADVQLEMASLVVHGEEAITLLGDSVSAGVKAERKLVANKRFGMDVCGGGAMTCRGDAAYGGSLEAHLLGSFFLSTLGLSVVDGHGGLAIGGNIQTQVHIGRSSDLTARANLNSREAVQMSECKASLAKPCVGKMNGPEAEKATVEVEYIESEKLDNVDDADAVLKLVWTPKADGTLNEAAISNVTKALQDIDGVSNLKVQVSEGVAVVELSKQTTVQATGVASSLVETIQGAGFKLQTLNLSFEDEDEVLV
ncbi:hypothetical protein Bca101_000846 [Brassica carinata]